MSDKVEGKTITKKDLILRIADTMGIKRNLSRDIVQTFLDEITDELAAGNRIELRDFGIFEVRTRRRRQARNPKTGESVQVPPKRIVSIKPGKKMKQIIEASTRQNHDSNPPPNPAAGS